MNKDRLQSNTDLPNGLPISRSEQRRKSKQGQLSEMSQLINDQLANSDSTKTPVTPSVLTRRPTQADLERDQQQKNNARRFDPWNE